MVQPGVVFLGCLRVRPGVAFPMSSSMSSVRFVGALSAPCMVLFFCVLAFALLSSLFFVSGLSFVVVMSCCVCSVFCVYFFV